MGLWELLEKGKAGLSPSGEGTLAASLHHEMDRALEVAPRRIDRRDTDVLGLRDQPCALPSEA